MAMYLIGDLQGCDDPLARLLDKIDFSPSRDTLFVLGDLVNRGPASAHVLRRLMGYGHAARCLLGNHDLHLLAAAHGVRKAHRSDTLHHVIDAPDGPALLEWLRHQRMAMLETVAGEVLLMVHAGVLPAWTAAHTLVLAAEVEDALRGPGLKDFLQHMYGNEPANWDESLAGPARLRVIVNALTRLRFCTADGHMEFIAKEGLDAAPPGHMPWYAVPGRQTAEVQVAFGHWSTLGFMDENRLWALDTGCVWGGKLSALRIGATLAERELIQIDCPQAQRPG
jgi:bis(5'-nucleosyl)-tetraphosphatase (symmetrical)